MLRTDDRSGAVTPTVVRCLCLEDLHRSVLFVLSALFPVKQTWEYQERWMHHTQFIERKEVVHSYYYLYCVRWSIPTAMRPMLQVSASAYFTVKITKNKPPVSSSFSALFTSMRLQ